MRDERVDLFPTDETATEHVHELLDRYFVNNIPLEDADLLRGSLQRAGVNSVTLEQMREIWESRPRVQVSAQDRIVMLHHALQLSHDQPPRGEAEHFTQSISVSSDGNRQNAERVISKSGSRTNSRRVWSALTAATLAVAIGIGGWLGGTKSIQNRMQTKASVYTTALGQRATIALPDGSTAVLNVGSRLDIPGDYAAGNRNVKLHGEALFTVKHHRGNPFTVTAGSSVSRVLGTSFVVRHYNTDTSTFVAVRDGKVMVGSTVLTANEHVFVRAGREVRVIQAVSPERFTFATGVLTLDGLSLRDAIVELNRWYDADIRIGDDRLTTRQITGGFPAGSLGDLIERFEWAFNMRVVRNGRVLTLYSR